MAKFTKALLRIADPTRLRSDDGVIDLLIDAEDLNAGRYWVVGIDDLTVTAVTDSEWGDVSRHASPRWGAAREDRPWMTPSRPQPTEASDASAVKRPLTAAVGR